MKSILLILLLLIGSISLAAKDLNIQACTSDYRSATLSLDFSDSASKTIENEVKAAFVKTASGLTAEELVSGHGFDVFLSNLTQEDYDAIIGINAAPIIGETCKLA